MVSAFWRMVFIILPSTCASTSNEGSDFNFYSPDVCFAGFAFAVDDYNFVALL